MHNYISKKRIERVQFQEMALKNYQLQTATIDKQIRSNLKKMIWKPGNANDYHNPIGLEPPVEDYVIN